MAMAIIAIHQEKKDNAYKSTLEIHHFLVSKNDPAGPVPWRRRMTAKDECSSATWTDDLDEDMAIRRPSNWSES